MAEPAATAVCGHRYRRWQAVGEFARPEVFTRCATCLRRFRAGRAVADLAPPAAPSASGGRYRA